jgi:hypothetical protein
VRAIEFGGVSGTQPFSPIATTAKILGIDEGRAPAGQARAFGKDRTMAAAPQTRFAKDHFRAAEIHSENTARPVGSKFVSAESLPKTGISAFEAGDFGDILAKVADFWIFGDGCYVQKSPKIAGISRLD